MANVLRRTSRALALVAAVLALAGVPQPATADGEGADAPPKRQSLSEEELAKKTQNPVADLISVPLQDNLNFNVGPSNRVQNVLNIQPVIPLPLGPDWNVITRTILPIVSQPTLFPGGGRDTGLGDLQFTSFLSPVKPGPGGIIWGAGPIFQFPTHTDDTLGVAKWAAGPSVVVLRSQGPWVYGVLVNNLWSFAGAVNAPDINQMLLQYFVNYNLPRGWYLGSAPIITANWKAHGGDVWTVPVGGGVGKVLRLGNLPINVQTQAFYNAATPDQGADWTLRLQIQLLFPR